MILCEKKHRVNMPVMLVSVRGIEDIYWGNQRIASREVEDEKVEVFVGTIELNMD